MKEVLTLFSLLIGVSVVTISASIVLPAPDGGVLAYTMLMSAMALTLFICADLSAGRINGTGDIMRAIENRQPLRLTAAAYLLGCSTFACTTVLLYRLATAL